MLSEIKNKQYAEQIRSSIFKMLSSCKLSEREFRYRERELTVALSQLGSDFSAISNRFYNLAHEIKSFYFLQQFGDVSIAEDSHHQPGCDCILKNKYQIECVCSSAGETSQESGLIELGTEKNIGKILNYSTKEDLLLCRFLNSIDKKRNSYYKHLECGTVSTTTPYIIFLGLGVLSREFFSGENGIEFTKIFYGKGTPVLKINTKTNKVENFNYTHRHKFLKYNHAEIDCNIFCSEKYCDISGIMITDADLENEYTVSNTRLFINPKARIKIEPEDFPNMVCWAPYTETVYGPFKDGIKIE